MIDQRELEHHPLKIFEAAKSRGRPAYISAPMVRYSKLPFRALVRQYDVDLCYTPMILAKEFTRSSKARETDFTTNANDRPLVVQFGSATAQDLGRAAEMVRPWCDGVNINCGCPQSWACQEGLGAQLMHEPNKVADMVRAAKTRCGPDFCVSVKIRLLRDVRRTLGFLKIVQDAGVDYVTVHGRQRSQRNSEPVDLEAIKLVKESATVPVVANGDAFTLDDVRRIADFTGVDGVMSARGLMENPTLFTGTEKTPWSAVEAFVGLAVRSPLPYGLVLHHVGEMARASLTRADRASLHETGNMLDLIDWVDANAASSAAANAGAGAGAGAVVFDAANAVDVASGTSTYCRSRDIRT